MADLPVFSFDKPSLPSAGTLVIFAAEGPELSPGGRELDEKLGGAIGRAAGIMKFTGKRKTAMSLLAPPYASLDRVIVIGLGDAGSLEEGDWTNLGGFAWGRLEGRTETLSVLAETSSGPVRPEGVAEFAAGIRLAAYKFRKYKKPKEDETPTEAGSVVILVEEPKTAASLFEPLKGVADGVLLARDLVNEPANVLGTAEFAAAAEALRPLGVEVEVLGEKELQSLEMRSLLAVGLGSSQESRVAIMRWSGGADKDARPVAFVGKGVVFDTGGISIKPAGSMEDMKGDMGGAACVVGLMHALAARKAKVNAIGVIGLVENMPDGLAQRPGDIVVSKSGRTIEVINTDAEGRMVLADLLTLVQERYKPEFIVDLATLTGAIIVALGHEYAGLFSNDDELSNRLTAAGKATGDKVWRMPLAKAYDKLIDSKFADVKNTGGRAAGSITAAHFLARFVEEGQAWAHLDIAGTAFGAPSNDVNKSWGSGFGVRLLDRLVRDHYEK
ncbi:leucyl aminopeptidase [Lutibaculum baratangense]|nr:leucyl aminopeptidase [Lutibaculum baratangense]